MSSSYGAIRFKSDGKLLYYLYDGTSDICIPSLCDDIEDIWKDNGWSRCKCGHDESVEIYSDYGSGFYWEGRACRHCKAITKSLEPWSNEDEIVSITDGQPEWLKEIWEDN